MLEIDVQLSFVDKLSKWQMNLVEFMSPLVVLHKSRYSSDNIVCTRSQYSADISCSYQQSV
jgi:hypothetical protein